MIRVLVFFAALLGAMAASAAPSPLDSEFQLNQFTSGDQQRPAVARAPDGSFLAAWDSDGQDGSENGIYARRYSAAGAALGDEFRVNVHTDNRQIAPRVAASGNGFVVVWISNSQDEIGIEIYARLFDANGVPRGGEFRVDTAEHPAYSQFDVAMAPDGRFVVSWIERYNLLSSLAQVRNLYARRYDANGVAQGSLISIYQTALYQVRVPSVAMDGTGNFVIAWFIGANSIWARRYDAGGNARGVSFRVSPVDTSVQVDRPQIASDAAGNFAIAWETGSTSDSSDTGIYLRSYNAAGAPRMNAARIDSHLLRNPEIAYDGAAIVVAAHSDAVYAQCYSLSGTALGNALRVDASPTLYTLLFASVASDANARLVFVWQNFAEDGSGRGVFARLFSAC